MADYTKTTWVDDDGSGTAGTALNATRLNNIETGVQDAAQHNKSGTLASRPAAAPANKGWLWYATDAATLSVSDGSSWLAVTSIGQVPQVRVTHSTTQPFGTGFGTFVFDTETYDLGTPNNNMHDTVTNNSRLTCRVAGLYSICGIIASASGSQTTLTLRLNGATDIGFSTLFGSAYGSSGPVITDYRLAVNDYVEFRGASQTLTTTAATTTFYAHWICP